MCEAEEVLSQLLSELEQKSRGIVGHVKEIVSTPRTGNRTLDAIEETRVMIASLQATLSAREMLDLVCEARRRLKVAGMQVEA